MSRSLNRVPDELISFESCSLPTLRSLGYFLAHRQLSINAGEQKERESEKEGVTDWSAESQADLGTLRPQLSQSRPPG